MPNMPNDRVEAIRLKLGALTLSEPDTIVPCLQASLRSLFVRVARDMQGAAMDAVLHDLPAASVLAEMYGRLDIADRLDGIEGELRDIRNGSPEPPESNGVRLGINFTTGGMSGGCSGCTAAEVAEALGAMAADLQSRGVSPTYIAFTSRGVVVEN